MTKKRVSELLLNLIAYGGFSYKKGSILLWNDPSIFFPIESFAILQDEIIKTWEKQGEEFIYSLGKFNGRNGTEILIKRFGINHTEIKKFIDGGSFDGWGYLSLKNYQYNKNKNQAKAIIESKNSGLALEYKRLSKKSKNPVEHFIRGELAGGAEPLYKKTVAGIETKCIAKGDSKCEFHLQTSDKKETSQLIKSAGLNEKDLIQISKRLTLQRPSSFNILTERPISFGDGSFYFKKIKGIIILCTTDIIMDKTLMNISPKKYSDILDKVAKSNIAILDKSFNLKKISLTKAINFLDIFGYGNFVLKAKTKDRIIIENTNNQYPKDYKVFFRLSKNPVDTFPSLLIKNLCEYYLDKKTEIEEYQCIAKGDSKCIFKISIK